MIKTKKHLGVLVACCLLMASSVGLCMNSVGIFYSPVAEALGVGRGDVAMQSTLSGIAAGLVSPLIVRCYERFNTKLCAILGVAVTALTTGLMGAATSALQLDILGLVRGVSYSFFSMIPVNMVLMHWFEHGYGLVTGFVFSFSGLGGVLFNSLLGGVIVDFGWRAGYLVVAGLILLLGVPSCFFISLPTRRRGKDGSGQSPEAARPAQGRRMLLSPMFIGLSVFTIGITFLIGFGQFIPDYAEEAGQGLAFGATMLSCAMVGNIVSKFLLGWLSDHRGPVFSTLIMVGSCTLGLFIMLVCGMTRANPAVLLAASVFFGGTYSITAVGISLVTRRFFGLERYGEAYGYISVLLNVGSALPFAVIGYSYDLFHTYRAAIWLCLGLCVAAAGILAGLGRKAAKKEEKA